MFKFLLILPLLFVLAFIGYKFVTIENKELVSVDFVNLVQEAIISSPSPPPIQLITPPEVKILPNTYHIFQSFNNCGPASLSMALSYFDINVSQTILGQELRPYQVAGGDNDDKSVTLSEMAKKGEEYGLLSYHRPNGNFDIIKKFIAYDIPILTRTWTKPAEDVGHFRLIKGYDQTSNEIIQDDSLQGKNLRYSVDDFDTLWKKFNYEYLVLVPKDKKEIAEAILEKNLDEEYAWKEAVKISNAQLEQNPDDFYAGFNLSVAYFHLKDYRKSTKEFEKVESRLPFRTLWYQIEPIKSYFELGDYERVFQITEKVLNYYNRAFSELYLLRGESHLKLGEKEKARLEFEKAVLYNKNLKEAIDALAITKE